LLIHLPRKISRKRERERERKRGEEKRVPFGKCAGGAEGEDVAVFQPTGHVGAADRPDVGVCKLFLIVVVLFAAHDHSFFHL